MKSRERHVLAASEYYNFSPSELARMHWLYVLCAGDFHYQAGYDLYRQSFDGLLLEIILEGQVQIETEGETLSAHAGQVVLIDCTKPHRYGSATGWHALWVHLEGAPARGYMSLIHRQNGRVFSTHRQHVVHDALQGILDMFRHQQISEAKMALLLTQAMTAMTEPPAAANDRTGLIDRSVTLINRSVGQEPSVAELARMVGMSEYHFIRVFREVMGVTPGQYVIASRMNYARYLLKTTALPVAEIGSMAGYASESMFTAAFRRTQGITPSAYRAGDLSTIITGEEKS